MKGERFEQEIRDSLNAEVEQAGPPSNLAGGVMLRLGNQERSRQRFKFIPRTRLAWAIVGLSLLLVGGTAYAATSMMSDFFHSGAPDIEQGLIVNLNLSQTIDGVTVTLVQGYADSNTVLIGYTVTGRNARYDAFSRQLSVIGGPSLNAISGTGYIPTPEILGWRPTKTTIVAGFDSSTIGGSPSELNLRFETNVSDSVATSGTTWGPFVFDFKLPFHPGKTVVVNQTVEAAGVPITLQKVLIAPSDTKAVFMYYGNFTDNRQRPLQISVLQPSSGTGGNQNQVSVNASNTWFPEDFTLDTYPGDFTNRPGEWTVTITELVFKPPKPPGWTGGDYSGKASDVKRLAGPWVFRFDVP